MTTLYARREVTTDSATSDMFRNNSAGERAFRRNHPDVQLYADRHCTRKAARFPWHYASKPTRRNKYVTGWSGWTDTRLAG